MNRILIAAFATVSFTGLAAAQQAPVMIGDYSDNVQQSAQASGDTTAPSIDFMSTASVEAMALSQSWDSNEASSRTYDIYTGK